MEALARLRCLPSVHQRRAACLLGAVVADTAVAPLHWIYDQDKVAGLVSSGMAEFSRMSHCPFYTVRAGEPSAYGIQIQVTMEGLVQDNGFDAAKQADRLYKHFGPGTSFEETRKQKESPVKGCWTNHSLKIFMAKREEEEADQTDAGSKDPDGLLKAIAIVAMYHGRPELLAKVEECVRVTQSHPVAVRYALASAKILRDMITTGELSFDKVSSELKDSGNTIDAEIASDVEKAIAAKATPHTQMVKKNGMACSMPPSFLGMMHGIACASTYTDAVRNEILAAGDNCSRASFVGSYMAAKCGLDSIPEEWIQKMNKWEQILTWIETIVKF